jgi:hypothetical protein
VIINPLQQLLRKPSTARHILEELEVLKYRFCDCYTFPEVDWNFSFDTTNWLLEQTRGEQIPALAEAITKHN